MHKTFLGVLQDNFLQFVQERFDHYEAKLK